MEYDLFMRDKYKVPLMMFILFLIEFKILILVFQASALVESTAHMYAGSQLLKVTPQNDDQVSLLMKIRPKYDFWTDAIAIGKPVSILSKMMDHYGLKTELREARLDYHVAIADVQKSILDHREANNCALSIRRREMRDDETEMSWTAFHTYDEIMKWIDSLPNKYGGNVVTVENLDKSYEGRELKLVKISSGGGKKPAMFIDGGMHAREWISPATVTYIINELLTKSNDLYKDVDMYFMPMINPDGYAYTHTNDRMWRKTRSPNAGSPCVGTDPNRNWNFKWMVSGATQDPCDEVYAGTKAFSEVEMSTVRDQLMKYGKDTIIYLTYHSFAQCLLYGWGYDKSFPDDVQDLNNLATLAAKAISNVNGTVYCVGSAGDQLSPASGASDDFAKAIAGIKYSYTIELCPNGGSNVGFLLPPDQIILCAKEQFEAFRTFVNHIKNNNEQF